MTNAILFDLDNTLYMYDPCHAAGIAASTHYAAKESLVPENEFQSLYDQARKVIKERTGNTAASHDRMLYFQEFVRIATGQNSSEHAFTLQKLYWEHYIDTIQINPGVTEFISLAKTKDYKLAIVSDHIADIQHRKLIKLGLADAFDVVVTSEEAGADKPDPAMLDLALSILGSTRDNAIMIGDNPKRDIAGAKSIGIPAYLLWVESKDESWGASVADFEELTRVIFE